MHSYFKSVRNLWLSSKTKSEYRCCVSVTLYIILVSKQGHQTNGDWTRIYLWTLAVCVCTGVLWHIIYIWFHNLLTQCLTVFTLFKCSLWEKLTMPTITPPPPHYKATTICSSQYLHCFISSSLSHRVSVMFLTTGGAVEQCCFAVACSCSHDIYTWGWRCTFMSAAEGSHS